MSSSKFDFLKIFRNFLDPLALSRLETREATRITCCYIRYQASFYLCRIRLVPKHCKVPKYYDQDCN